MIRKILNIGLISISIVGLTGTIINTISTPSVFAEEDEPFTKKHETIDMPTRILMSDIEGHAQNIYEDIVKDDYDSIKKETDAISKRSKEIVDHFFPIDPGLDSWYRRSKALDPEILKAIETLKSNFGIYLKRLSVNLTNLQNATEIKDEKKIISAFTTMVEHACVKCHSRYAGIKAPVLDQYLKIEPHHETGQGKNK